MPNALFIAPLAAALLAVMPVASAAQTEKPQIVADGDESTWKWPSNDAEVCFLNPTHEWSVEKDWVREAIETSWEHYSDIDLTFHMDKDCHALEALTCGVTIQGRDCDTQIVRIELRSDVLDGDSSYAYTGKGALNREDMEESMSINMLACQGRKTCIQAVTRHEFGHVLGFWHEHRRSDADSACADRHPPKEGDTALVEENFLTAEYDPDSIMNYCRSIADIFDSGRLSQEDIRGLQAVYGDGGSPIDDQDKYRKAAYIGEMQGCRARYPKDDRYEAAFLHVLTDQCYACPLGKSRTANPDVNAKTACEAGAFFFNASRAVLRGRPGCPTEKKAGHGAAFQHGLGGACYACPEGYARTAIPQIGDLRRLEKACVLVGRPGD